MDILICALQRDPISFSQDVKQTYLSSDRKHFFCLLRLCYTDILKVVCTKRKRTAGISARYYIETLESDEEIFPDLVCVCMPNLNLFCQVPQLSLLPL